MGRWKVRKAVRAAFKAATYRVIGAVETFGVAWFFTGHVGWAAGIMVAEAAYKGAVYFGHEMLWSYATEEE